MIHVKKTLKTDQTEMRHAYCSALIAAAQKDDRSILGYFFDNELAWGAKGSSETGLYDAVAKMPATESTVPSSTAEANPVRIEADMRSSSPAPK